MTRFTIALAAAGFLLAMPTFITPAAADPGIKLAQADVRIQLGNDRRRGDFRPRMHRRDRCTTTVVIRNGRKSTIRRCR
jgi:hypothetical protein